MTYLQYYGLISAIPQEWVTELRKTRHILESYQLPYENFVGKMTARIYDKQTDDKDLLKPLCQKWQDKLRVNIIYEEFLEHFSRIYNLTKSTKFQSFQFRFLHRIIFTSDILYKWKIVASPRCSFCSDEYETIEHLFYHCTITKRFWEMLQSWYECQTNTEIEFSIEEIFFCNHELDILNVLFLLAKQFIFNRHCLDKELNIYTFREYVMEVIRIERFEAFKTRKFKKFVKKWKDLFF